MALTHPSIPGILDFINQHKYDPPEIGVVLGSGLGALAAEVKPQVSIKYTDIPGYLKTQIPGHSGQLIIGELVGKQVALFSGRSHFYEGLKFDEVTFPVQISHALGATNMLLSTSVGGVNKHFQAGDFMMISDHINLSGRNPIQELIKRTDDNPFLDSYSPFVDMCNTYRIDLYPEVLTEAKKIQATLHKGVLAIMLGPIYETPAEVRMLQMLGADVVSMSTVPEATMAKYLKMKTIGMAMVTNAAHAQITSGPTHKEVLAISTENAPKFVHLMKKVIELI